MGGIMKNDINILMAQIVDAENQTKNDILLAEENASKMIVEANLKADSIRADASKILKEKKEKKDVAFQQELNDALQEGNKNSEAKINELYKKSKEKIADLTKQLTEEILSECQQ